MTNGDTYIIVCRQGRRKDECPLIIERKWSCPECTMAGYILRERNNQENNQEDNQENDI